MSQVTETLHGFGRLGESSSAPAVAPGAAPIGALVGRSGRVFETEVGTGPERRVIKLFPWAAKFPVGVVASFTHEAMMVAQLRHPHVVQLADAGRLGDGTPYVVMERLDGRTLEELLEVGPVPAADLPLILRGVASALAAAHAAGVVHGELTADNVFLAEVAGYRWGFPKLLDFGVFWLGAAGYARPGLDQRADQRALAAIADRMHGGLLPRGAQRVLERAKSAHPEQQFGSATSFIEALEDALVVIPAASAPVAVAVAAPAAVPAPAPAAAPVAAPAPVAVPAPVPAAAPVAAPAPVAAHVPVAMAVAATVPAPLAARPLASPPSSLTQQFFAEGEKQELAHAAEAVADDAADDAADDEEAADDDDGGHASDVSTLSLGRVPRSRFQIATAAFLALGSVAIVVGTIVSLSGAARSPSPSAPQAVTRPADVPYSPPKAPPRVRLVDAPAPEARIQGRRVRSQFGPASAPRAAAVEPPRFIGSAPVAPAPAPNVAPAVPTPDLHAFPEPAAIPAPTPVPDGTVVDEDVTQPWEQTDGEPMQQ